MRKRFFIPIIITAAIFLLSLIGYITILFLGDYVIDEKKLIFHASSKIVDQNGEEVTSLYTENRRPISIAEVPDGVKNAFIAVEDKRFYEHHGIDFKSVSRAVYKDILAGGKVEGGSTITQQLAKNTFLTHDKTFLRKTKEVIIAINLERDYSKDKLLEMYLNQLYFGHGVYGIQAAANYFFSKDVKDLTVSEGAVLASIPKAPSTYSPILNPEKSRERRNVILGMMNEQGYISSKETVRAQGSTLGLHVKEKSKNPWLDSYIDLVMKEAEDKYSISSEQLLQGGYTISVPLDVSIQKAAYTLMKQDVYFPGTDNKAEGSAVFIDNRTGGVVAALGGREYAPKGYNRATAPRQPGSTFKPLAVYGPALEEKLFKPYSMLEDKQLSYGGYSPKNYDGQYEGKVSMVDALTYSKNAPAVWTLNEIGIETVKPYLSRLGMNVPDEGLALGLGGLEKGVSPLELAGAYRTFANSGQYTEPFFINKITDENGDVMFRHENKSEKVFSKQTAWNMTRMLEEVVKSGTGKAGDFSGEIAGKTGSTTYTGKEGGTKDAWFAGYTTEVTGAVWMGYDKTDESHYLKGGSAYPTRLFKDILKRSNHKPERFKAPEGVKDLDRPIRLEDLESVKADYSFTPMGLITVSLKWHEQEDKRVEYRIYERKNGKETLIDTVKGKGSYSIPYANIFSNASYKIVPYNPQTKTEGKGTDYIEPKVFPSGH
ncbi:transglycosylase domain-containing protein [Bacillus paralicheniformis]|uniref:Multimodular transpeptidase-transglycosylase n=1 Tax=Bacillus paralicheniformis TaxID=1648923 RepID=A0A7Z1B4S3_9BACI|nr:transglycosylase domain-containing protein [Bacillus paralicheniformis]KFM89718.1 penicillin-binding, 1A family protein [Bacillus paralicheniformis]MDR4214122.1 penicillin-binding protein [Bacillus paralicheniformis]MDU0412864.1 transglycosylase domain-containing protein [Bacillus paralicheniformis]MEB3129789.1 transglycosylase domain-containing protein [Bacillus paralicheniformis]MEC2170615.1 transglycosylase domain-containing protein [Bacillus paralicheniformis]